MIASSEAGAWDPAPRAARARAVTAHPHVPTPSLQPHPQLPHCLPQGHLGPAQDLLDKAHFTLRPDDQPKADVLGVHEAEVSGSEVQETKDSCLSLLS